MVCTDQQPFCFWTFCLPRELRDKRGKSRMTEPVSQSWGKNHILWQRLLVVHVVWIFLLSVEVPPTQWALFITLKRKNNIIFLFSLNWLISFILKLRFNHTTLIKNKTIKRLWDYQKVQSAVTEWAAMQQCPLLQCHSNTLKLVHKAGEVLSISL